MAIARKPTIPKLIKMVNGRTNKCNKMIKSVNSKICKMTHTPGRAQGNGKHVRASKAGDLYAL